VPIFIGRGAPFWNTPSAPKAANLQMQAVELHPLIVRLTISMYYDDELSALSP